MKISELKKEFNFKFITIASAVVFLALATLALGGFGWYKYFPNIKDRFAVYMAEGKALEYGSQAAVPDLRIQSGVLHMFTDYGGFYRWPDLIKNTQITLNLPDGYEKNASGPVDYTNYKEIRPFKRTVNYNFYLVLNVEKSAERIFDYLAKGSYSNIWTYLTNKSQALWSDKSSDFENALSTERSLRARKDQSQLESYEILGKTEINGGGWLFNVLWTQKNGETFKTAERFERQAGWWHYVWQRNPKEVYQYIDYANRH